MAYICDICKKGRQVGRTHQHKRGVAGKRWKKRAQVTLKIFKPNLQKVTVLVSGKKRQMRLCTKCIKKIKKDNQAGKYKNISVV